MAVPEQRVLALQGSAGSAPAVLACIVLKVLMLGGHVLEAHCSLLSLYVLVSAWVLRT